MAQLVASELKTFLKAACRDNYDHVIYMYIYFYPNCLTLFRPGFFLLPRTGGGGGGGGFGGPTPVTLQPLMVWLPNLHRTIYSLFLSSRYSLFVTMT